MTTDAQSERPRMIRRLVAAVEELDAAAGWKAESEQRLRDGAAHRNTALAREHAEALRPGEALRRLEQEQNALRARLHALPRGTRPRSEVEAELAALRATHAKLDAAASAAQAEHDELQRAATEAATRMAELGRQHRGLDAKINDRLLIVQIVMFIFGDADATRRDQLVNEMTATGIRQEEVRQALAAATQRLPGLAHEVDAVQRRLASVGEELRKVEAVLAAQQALDAVEGQMTAAREAERARLDEAAARHKEAGERLAAQTVAERSEADRTFDTRWQKGVEDLDGLCRQVRRRQPRLDEMEMGAVAPDGPLPDALAVGRVRVRWRQWSGSVPRLVPFPFRTALRFAAGDPHVNEAVESLLLRLMTALPCGGLQILACDPRHLGQSLGRLRPLLKAAGLFLHGRVLTRAEEIETAMQREVDALEENLQTRFNAPDADWVGYNRDHPDTPLVCRVLLLFDVPDQTTDKSFHFLGRLVEHGPRCGLVPVLVLHDPAPDDRRYARFRATVDPLLLNLEAIPAPRPRLEHLEAEERPEPLPDDRLLADTIRTVAERYASRGLRTNPLARLWNDVPLWGEASAAGLRAPLGWRPTGEPVFFEFGGVGTEHHALLAGRSGTGKSNLLHVLLHSLCHRYSPEQLRLFLLDYKQGTELSVYADPPLPHAALVATESDPEYGVTVLEHLAGEIDRRADAFKRLGVRDVAEYARRATAPLARWLLVIDEFQVLFSEGRQVAEPAERLLTKLLRQGRAYGLHVLLATQTLKGIQTQSMSQLSSQIGLRLCLACGEEDSAAILGATNWAGATLRSPPEALLNASSGAKSGNVLLRVPRATEEVCAAHLRQFAREASARELALATKVFDGSGLPPAPTPDVFRDLLADHQGPALVLGRRLDYQADALVCPFARRAGANLLCVGPDGGIRRGLLEAVVNSFAGEIAYLRLRQDDEAGPPPAWPPRVRHTVLADDDGLEDLLRAAAGSRLLVIDGLDHGKTLQSGGPPAKPSPAAAALRRWLDEGPPRGGWTVALADNWSRVASAYKDLLPAFQLRVGFCLNEDHAGALASGGYDKLRGLEQPTRALFVDQHRNARVPFRPFRYTPESREVIRDRR